MLYSISISRTRRDHAQLFMAFRLAHRWCRCVSDREPSPDPRLLSLGMQIRRHREERGYSLEELAERSGLSFRGLIYIEHGQRNPSVLTLVDIAAALDIAPGELVNHLTEGHSA
ncbi:helix-turn-helix domain-containing protein [Streptomyces sp. MBT62]|uniref:helix-turn-helix domain-containing protein n=1 Tax=Streptomyces sp. MBT62 TaxID=2800410 RepID=UPI001F27BDD3|nr:helix-turn-helix transcriptional regulator [Streptomyces sp. MBT62]